MMRTLLIALAALALAPQAIDSTDFVGTVPCGEAVRAFVGGMAAGAPCQAITFQLTLRGSANSAGRWTLAAQYGVPRESNPNQMTDGPRVVLEGALERTRGTTFDQGAMVDRLVLDNPRRSLSLVELNNSVLHALTASGELMVGTGGWSYTFYRADRVEPPAVEGPGNPNAYTIPPRATGANVFGVFEGRSPCRNFAQAIQRELPGCARAKWRLTLFWDAAERQPTTYRLDGSIYRENAREGRWRNGRGTGPNPDATVFQLDATANEGPILLLRGSNDVLFFLDAGRSPLVGTKDLSYTLNRVRN